MNNKAQSSFAIGVIVALLVVVFILVAGLLFYSFGVFKTGKAIDNGVDNNAQTNQPVVIIINKPTTEKPNNDEGIRGIERVYLDYTDWKKETEDQCTVYIRNTGDISAFFTVEFYLEDINSNSSDERETDREKYVVPGEKESFSVSIDEDERCDYEIYVNGEDRYLGMMDDYDYYRYLRNLNNDCDRDCD